jgi:hypothetical protein
VETGWTWARTGLGRPARRRASSTARSGRASTGRSNGSPGTAARSSSNRAVETVIPLPLRLSVSGTKPTVSAVRSGALTA